MGGGSERKGKPKERTTPSFLPDSIARNEGNGINSPALWSGILQHWVVPCKLGAGL